MIASASSIAFWVRPVNRTPSISYPSRSFAAVRSSRTSAMMMCNSCASCSLVLWLTARSPGPHPAKAKTASSVMGGFRINIDIFILLVVLVVWKFHPPLEKVFECYIDKRRNCPPLLPGFQLDAVFHVLGCTELELYWFFCHVIPFV